MTSSFNGTRKVTFLNFLDETPSYAGLGERRTHSKCLLPMNSILHVLIALYVRRNATGGINTHVNLELARARASARSAAGILEHQLGVLLAY
jgi:hypothetical protein